MKNYFSPKTKIESQKVQQNFDEIESGWLTPYGDNYNYFSSDSPSHIMTVTGDKRGIITPGMRFKCSQVVPVTTLLHFEGNANDDSGNGRHGVASNVLFNASYGKYGQGASFTIANASNISFTDNPAFKPTGDFTIGMWMKNSVTGTWQELFSSFQEVTGSGNTYWGILFRIGTGNKLNFFASDNTRYITIDGSRNVCDGNLHYVEVKRRGNVYSLYVDGTIDAIMYDTLTPVYNASNYPRLGCRKINGAVFSEYYGGYMDDFVLINGVATSDARSQAVYASGFQLSASWTEAMYFIATDISYSAPNSSIVLYGGNHSYLSGQLIDSPLWSKEKLPSGFPSKLASWEIEYDFDSTVYQASPVLGTLYNIGGIKFSVPIGSWSFYVRGVIGIQHATGVGTLDMNFGFSASLAGFTYPALCFWSYLSLSTGNQFWNIQNFSSEIAFENTAKILVYFLAKTNQSGLANIGLRADGGRFVIRIRPTYL